VAVYNTTNGEVLAHRTASPDDRIYEQRLTEVMELFVKRQR